LSVHLVLLLHEIELLPSRNVFLVIWSAMKAFDNIEGFLASAFGE
jgi:hypothetical protein